MQSPRLCLLSPPPHDHKAASHWLVPTPSGQPQAFGACYSSRVPPFSHFGLMIFSFYFKRSAIHLTFLFKNMLTSILKFSVLKLFYKISNLPCSALKYNFLWYFLHTFHDLSFLKRQRNLLFLMYIWHIVLFTFQVSHSFK